MKRVVVIGWDGATWDLLLPWARAGLLPNVARLLQAGAHGPLRSTIQPLTAVAWTSFLTGCRPGRHGLFDFIERPRGSYAVSLTGRHRRRVPGLWELLSAADKRVAAVNVPMMVPVPAVNGILVGGIDAPGLAAETVFPAAFVEEIRTAVPHYRIAASERTLDQWAVALKQMVDGRIRLLDHLRRREHWDCLMVVFSATDIAQHIFWGHMTRQDQRFGELILEIYQAADQSLGRLLDERDAETTLLLMSDHGAGPLKGALHINSYLAQGGFLTPATAESSALRHALQLGKRFLPPPGRAWLRRRFGALRDNVESRLVAAACDWSQTAVFSVGSYGHLYFNIAGREPQGIVPPDGVARLATRIADHLHALREPIDGQPLVKKVWPGDELYAGPAVDVAPDLVIEWANHAYEIRARYGAGEDAVFTPTAPLNDLAPETLLTATHRPEGIVAAVGPHITPGPLTGAHIVDLAPTILHTLGVNLPGHVDGRALANLTAGLGTPHHQPVERMATDVNGLNRSDEQTVVDRLRSLGYLH